MKGVATQSRAPDIPAKRRPLDWTRSFRLNPDDQENVSYLLELWGEEDPRLTANGVVRRALTLAASFERQRRSQRTEDGTGNQSGALAGAGRR